MRNAMKLVLEQDGYEVATAASAEEALRNAGRGDPPHVVVSDYRLSSSWDGIKLVYELRRGLQCEIPAVLLTGDITLTQLPAADAATMRLLHKPVGIDDLSGAIGRLLAPAGVG